MKRAARLFRALFLPRGKFAIFFLIFLIVWPTFIPLIAAGQESSNYAPPVRSSSTEYAPNVPRDENSAMQVRLINVLAAIGCQISGINPAYPNRPCVGIDKVTEKISFVPEANSQVVGGGAIGFVNTMMAAMYAAPAASTGDYLAYLGDNFGFVKKAEAQGVGFKSLSPILPLWTAARNVAYFFYILAFVVIGILIMIRVRIDPRTVMTIQNQVPKIVIGIILITFSYAMAGFLIDFMYTSIYVVTNVVTSIPIPSNVETRERLFAEGDPRRTSTETLTYADIGLGPSIINSTNPISAAGNLYETKGWGPDAIYGLGVISWKPAEEIGDGLGRVFNNPLGEIVGDTLFAVISLIMIKSIPGQATTGFAKYLPFAASAFVALSFLPIPGAQVIGPLGASIFAVAPLAIRSGQQNWRSFGGAARGLGWGAAAATAGLLTYEALDALSGRTDNIAETLFSIIAFIIIAVAILSSLIRIWFTLMKSYLLILIITIMSPFYILFGLLPGSNLTFSSWVRALMANLAAFPITIVLLLVGRVVIDGLGATQAEGLFVPPLLGNASISGTIQSIVGLTFILLVPNAIDIGKSLFQTKSSPYGATASAAGAAGFGYAVGLVRNPLSIMSQAEEYRISSETGGYEKVGPFKATMRRILG
ncbi:MAG: hypothetical protein HYV40_02445 [Candidatus Levybacteria bacterium]|nr:hypothetical protein [Candidatus Levybacteria bacterium]